MSPPKTKSDKYAKQSRYQAKRARETADIGEIQQVFNPARKATARLDLFFFLTTYFPNSTGLTPFSEDHRKVIARIQGCALGGGRFVNAVYRGFAKTSISEGAALWAVLFGHRRFVPVFSAEAGAAEEIIDSIKMELSENDLLYEDFPEACHAIRALEGKPQRCAGQTHTLPCEKCKGQDGDCQECGGFGSISRRTHIEWTADKVVMPQISGSVCSGSILCANGVTAASRGMKHKRPDGVQLRPDFIILDDIQTTDSVGTPAAVEKRLGLITKNILKGGGHQKNIACVLNATVMAKDDAVERFLDPVRSPAWQGERIKMVKRFADENDSLWLGQYRAIRNTYDPEAIDDQKRAHAACNEFYKLNRAAMDKGCIISWESCFDPVAEISAIQHAYNFLIDDGPEVFASECQNEPLEPHQDADTLKPSDVARKVNGLARGAVPLGAEHIAAFVDVQHEILYYMVCAWSLDFTGSIIDYGTFPHQHRPYFALADISSKLKDLVSGAGLEGRVYAGLEETAKILLEREWRREDGSMMRIEKLWIDASEGRVNSTVNQFCRRSKHAAILMPAHGKYVGAGTLPWDHYQKREGERLGNHWMMPALKGKVQPTRHVLVDTNWWKSFLHTRLAVRLGDKGCLSIFGKSPDEHRMLADHIAASEYRLVTEGRGRKCDEWKLKPSRPDNHFFDCAYNCCAMADFMGCSLMGNNPVARRRTGQRRAVAYLS